MGISVAVSELDNDCESSLDDLHFQHKNCSHGVMRVHRDVITDEHLLRCGCGIQVVLFASDEALTSVWYTAIDCQARSLPHGSYVASTKEQVGLTSTRGN